MKTKFRWILISLTLFFIATPSLLSSTDKLVNTVYRVSGLDTQVAQMQTQVTTSLDQYQATMEKALFEDFKKSILQHFDPQKLKQSVLSGLSQNLDSAELNKLKQWFESPIGKSIVAAEVAASAKSVLSDLNQFKSDFNKETTQASKQPVINQILKDTKTTDIMVQFTMNLTFMVFEKRNTVLPKDQQLPISAIRAKFNTQRTQFKAMMHNELLKTLLFTYRKLPITDLKSYLKFINSAEGKKFHTTTSKALYGVSPDEIDDSKPAIDLAQIATDSNKALPIMIDSETRLDQITHKENMLIYHYTLINYTSSQLDLDVFRKNITQTVIPTSCNNAQLSMFFQNGVSIQYIYFGNDKVELTTVTIHPKDCHKEASL